MDERIEVSKLNFSHRVQTALYSLKIRYLDELQKYSDFELNNLPNFGHKCLDEILKMLRKHGLCLKGDEVFRNNQDIETIHSIHESVKKIEVKMKRLSNQMRKLANELHIYNSDKVKPYKAQPGEVHLNNCH